MNDDARNEEENREQAFGTYGPPSVPPETIFAGGPPSLPPARRRPVAYLAVAIGLIAMAGGAVFFARSVGDPKGSETPDAAVQRVFDALSNEDFVGVLESLAPSERALLSGRIQTIAGELGRLGILSRDLDLADVRGIDLEFSGLKYSNEPIAEGFTAVTLTAGKSTYRIDPAASPLGEFVRGLLPRSAGEVITGSDEIVDEHPVFVTVKQGDTWFVSLWYSLAEQARRESGAPLPSFGAGVPARGAPSPEAAVEQFLRSAARLEVRRLIELMPPEEAAALHDYAPLFLADAERAVKEARSSFELSIQKLELSSRTSGDGSVVKIDTLAFRLSIPDLGLTATYDGRCVTVEGADVLGLPGGAPICADELTGAAGGLDVTSDVGIVAVEEGGLWYVSPGRTVLDGMIAMLKSLTPQNLDDLKKLFAGFGALPGFDFDPGAGIPIPVPSA